MSQDILPRITIIINHTFESNYSITESTSAEEIDEWDSITHIELITNIEKEFKVRFALGELQSLKNVGDLVNLVINKTAN